MMIYVTITPQDPEQTSNDHDMALYSKYPKPMISCHGESRAGALCLAEVLSLGTEVPHQPASNKIPELSHADGRVE